MDVAVEQLSEERQVYLNRYKEAREAGLIPEEAAAFAESGYDIGLFRWLIRSGCALEHLRRIVL